MLDQKGPVSIKRKAMGGILSAIFSSVCCTLPLLFTALGVGAGTVGFLGGLGRFAGAMVSYQPIFVLLAILFLSLGFLTLYRRGACNTSTCSPEQMKKTKQIWWVIAAITFFFLLFPYLLESMLKRYTFFG